MPIGEGSRIGQVVMFCNAAARASLLSKTRGIRSRCSSRAQVPKRSLRWLGINAQRSGRRRQSRHSGWRNADLLARKDQVRILDHFAVGLEDLRILAGVLVKVQGDRRQ